MAKRSVFDEDLKRLENVGEKYEPKELNLIPRVGSCTTLTSQQQQTSVPATTLSAPPPTLKLAPITQLPKTPTMLSPRSTGMSEMLLLLFLLLYSYLPHGLKNVQYTLFCLLKLEYLTFELMFK